MHSISFTLHEYSIVPVLIKYSLARVVSINKAGPSGTSWRRPCKYQFKPELIFGPIT